MRKHSKSRDTYNEKYHVFLLLISRFSTVLKKRRTTILSARKLDECKKRRQSSATPASATLSTELDADASTVYSKIAWKSAVVTSEVAEQRQSVSIIDSDDSDTASTVTCYSPSTIPESLSMSYEELKCSVSDLHVGQFLFAKDNSKITFVQLSNDVNPKVKISVVISEDFQVTVHIRGKQLDPSHDFFRHIPPKIVSPSHVNSLLLLFYQWMLCVGVTDVKLCRLASLSNAHCVMSERCTLIVSNGQVCLACRTFRKILLMKHRRAQSKAAAVGDLSR